MSTMTPAEELRAAAALMRERAEAATPGTWSPAFVQFQDEPYAAVLGPEGKAEEPQTWLMATGHGGASQESDADHAASWHPLVAQAVAEWLETEAHMAEARGNGAEGQTFHALKIARAYIGAGDEGGDA